MTKPNEFDPRALYDIYQVKIRMNWKICGGTPKNKEVLKKHIARTTEHDDELTQQQFEEANKALLDPSEENSWNGFPADPEKGIFIWTRQIKAMFKESATMLRITVDKKGSKQIFQHGFEVKGPDDAYRVFLGKQAPDGCDEGPIHVQTAQGPRTALKRVDYADNPVLSFEVWVLTTKSAENRHVGEEDIKKMLTFAQENGLGADRSQGAGKFSVLEFSRAK